MNDKNKRLFEAFLSCETIDDISEFLDDICTYTEIEAMADRLWVATLLSKGHTYEYIEGKTSISSATISRVNRSLIKGTGYKRVLSALDQSE